jgi:hypothetical protein
MPWIGWTKLALAASLLISGAIVAASPSAYADAPALNPGPGASGQGAAAGLAVRRPLTA